MNDGQISDAEYNIILREVEQYNVLKNGLRKEMKSEGVDVEAIKQQIKDEYQKKLGSLVNIRNLNIQFEKRADGFSFSISKVVNN